MIPIRVVDFWKDKYGSELLADMWRVEALLGPLLHNAQPHRLTFYDIMLLTGGSGTFIRA